MPVSTSKIKALIERCQRVHALLYRRNPAAYTLERRDLVKEAAAGSSNSLWAIFENLAIFPGTKVRKLRKYLSSLVFALLACRDKKNAFLFFFGSGAGKDPWLSTIGTLATTLTQIAVVGE